MFRETELYSVYTLVRPCALTNLANFQYQSAERNFQFFDEICSWYLQENVNHTGGQTDGDGLIHSEFHADQEYTCSIESLKFAFGEYNK